MRGAWDEALNRCLRPRITYHFSREWSGLVTWLNRFFRRAPRPEPVELDLHQQLAVLALARFGPCGFVRLYDEVGAIRRTTEAELANALLKMDAAGIIERESDPKTAQRLRRYTLTRRGRRLTRYIPKEPRSAIEFYV